MTGDNWIKELYPHILVPVPGVADKFLKELLQSRADRQLDYLIDALAKEAHDMLPPSLRSLDYETNGHTSDRIRNMLIALREFINNPPELVSVHVV